MTTMLSDICIVDDAVPDPEGYRARALSQSFGDVTVGPDVFRGVAPADGATLLAAMGRPGASVGLSFFRQSPQGQREPNYIHSDVEMGDWTGVLYLTPNPPQGDGTAFWRHQRSGRVRGAFDPVEAKTGAWKRWKHVEARFNRLLVFPSDYFHSRGLVHNYGTGVDARLTQVVFGRNAQRPGVVSIRPAVLADVPWIIAMAQRFVAQTAYRGALSISPARLTETAAWLIESPDGLVLVAEREGALVGMLGMTAYQHHWSGERVASELVWWMEPGERGSAGVRMLKQAEQWARDQGALAMQMIAPSDRVGTFYEKCGYTRLEVAYQRRF